MSSRRLGVLLLTSLGIGIFMLPKKKEVPLSENNLPVHVQNLFKEKEREELSLYSGTLETMQVQRESLTQDEWRRKALHFSFKSMHELSANVNKQSLRQKIMDSLLYDRGNIEFARRILLDNDFVRTAFGEDQAIARVYSIELLRHAAERGDSLPLQMTTRELVECLSEKELVSAGEWRDLQDLLINTIDVLEPLNVSKNFEEFLVEFSYSSKVLGIHEAFKRAFLITMLNTVPHEDLKHVMKSVWKNEL